MLNTDKYYIDYLDLLFNDTFRMPPEKRIRYDLLLFYNAKLLISVPACVKLEKTTRLLLELTPFFKDEKIGLTIDPRYKRMPFAYFEARKKKLEQSIAPRLLLSNYEYSSYISPHTEFFYNTFIGQEVGLSKNKLYTERTHGADQRFREWISTQIENNGEMLSVKLRNETENDHFEKILIQLWNISNDKKSFFERGKINEFLTDEYSANSNELTVVNTLLDRGFAYANGAACDAPSLSFIVNILTAKPFVDILYTVDRELYEMIELLDWEGVYFLSKSETWQYFVDNMNGLLNAYQASHKRKDKLFKPFRVKMSLTLQKLANYMYQYAFEALRKKMLQYGHITEYDNAKQQIDSLIAHKSGLNSHWHHLNELNKTIPNVKSTIQIIKKRHQSVSRKSEIKTDYFNSIY